MAKSYGIPVVFTLSNSSATSPLCGSEFPNAQWRQEVLSLTHWDQGRNGVGEREPESMGPSPEKGSVQVTK